MEQEQRQHAGARLASCVIAGLTLAVGSLLSAHTRLMHSLLHFSAYDVGIHLQALWKMSRLDGLFNTIRGLNYWGDHLWLSYALLAPVYRLWASPAVVYLYQGFGLAVGGLAVYGLARRRLRSLTAALVAALLYWCYPGVTFAAQENFHPDVLASTWLLLVLWAHEAQRPRVYWTAVALALLTKEDVALYLLGFAALTFLRGERRRALILGVVSAVYFLVAMKVLLPLFNGVGFFRFSGGYWFSGWTEHAFNPRFYAARLATPEVRTYVWDLLWPVAFLPLAHPLTLALLAGPAFLVNVIGGGYLVSVHYHYLYGIIPGIFAATIDSLESLERLGARLLAQRRDRQLAGAVVFGAILAPCIGRQIMERDASSTYVGMATSYATYSRVEPSAKAQLIAASIARIPDDAKVSASFNLVPSLANRRYIFMFPNPWKPAYWGIAGEGLVSPERVDTLFLDTGAIDQDTRQLARLLLAAGWNLLVDEQDILLATRRVKGSPESAVEAPPVTPACASAGKLPQPLPKRVLLFGIDGATWDVIGPELDAGHLPNLKRLYDSGIHGVLESRPPILSPVVWSTIFTGRPWQEHGVQDWNTSQSVHRKVKALWNITSKLGLDTDVVNVPATWPPERIRGEMISGFPLSGSTIGRNTGEVVTRGEESWADLPSTYRSNRQRIEENETNLRVGAWSAWFAVPVPEQPTWQAMMRILRFEDDRYYLTPVYRTDDELVITHPPTLHADLAKQLAEPYVPEGPGWSRHAEEDTPKYLYDHLLQVAQGQTQAAALLAARKWDLFIYVDTLVDRVSHPYWPYMRPHDYVGVAAGKAARYADVVRNAYRKADAQLGEVLAAIEGPYVAVVVSDHGFHSSPDPSNLIGTHAFEGIYLVSAPGIQPAEGGFAYLEDVTPTLLYLLDQPIASDMKGTVIPQVACSVGRPLQQVASYEDGKHRGSNQPVDAATWEQLRSLGYVGDAAPAIAATPQP